jgi:hypothetical protein
VIAPTSLVRALALAALLAIPQGAAAQSLSSTSLNECWGIGIASGVSSVSSGSAATFGAAVRWDVSPRVGIEAGSSWINLSGRDDAVAVAIAAEINLTRRRAVMPFVRGGVGAYVMTVGAAADAPEFYARRLRGMTARSQYTFTDPSLVVGSGVNLRVSRQIDLRPMVDLVTVVRDGRTHRVTTATVQLAYRFETARITPVRR